MNPLHKLEKQFLTSTGWLQSIKTQRAVDASGAVPWFTYPAIRYLKSIVRPHWRVLEYGSGNSTRWWSKNVASVTTVEHDPVYAKSIRDEGLENVAVIERVMDDIVPESCQQLLRESYFTSGCFGRLTPDPTRNYRAGLLDAPYAAYASVGLEYPAGHFDVVVVDGMARAMTAWVAARQVAAGGVVVFDNADRDEYREGFRALTEAGFARIDFWGLGPINPYEWCTSLFIRTLEVLNRQGIGK